MSVTRNFTVAADSYEHASMQHGNHGDCSAGGHLVVEGTSADQSTVHLRFDQNSIPSGATVSSSTMQLYYYDKLGQSARNPAGQTYYVDRLTETDWVEGTACHGSQTGSEDWLDRQHSTLAWTTPGGTYTATDEASATVPSGFGWMSWTVTNQVQTAQNSGIASHFLVRDSSASDKQARFHSRERGANPAKLAVAFTAVWDSYNNSARSAQDDLFQTGENAGYMRGTGFNMGGSYVVGYYDGSGDKRCTEVIAAVGGTLDSICNFLGAAAAGTWNAVVFEPGITAPATFGSINSDTHKVIGIDTFTVEAGAVVPEMPSLRAGMLVAASALVVFIWFLRSAGK